MVAPVSASVSACWGDEAFFVPQAVRASAAMAARVMGDFILLEIINKSNKSNKSNRPNRVEMGLMAVEAVE